MPPTPPKHSPLVLRQATEVPSTSGVSGLSVPASLSIPNINPFSSYDPYNAPESVRAFRILGTSKVGHRVVAVVRGLVVVDSGSWAVMAGDGSEE